MSPDLWVPAVSVIAIVAIICGSLHSLLKMYMRRGGGTALPQADPREIRDGLGQLQQAVDAIAVEVERLSEGQRFTTRLLGEQARDAPQRPSEYLHR
jgi:hypothetical protein